MRNVFLAGGFLNTHRQKKSWPQQLDAEHLVYHSPKPRPDGSRDLVLTPLELIDRIAALVPPPRAHRNHY